MSSRTEVHTNTRIHMNEAFQFHGSSRTTDSPLRQDELEVHTGNQFKIDLWRMEDTSGSSGEFKGPDLYELLKSKIKLTRMSTINFLWFAVNKPDVGMCRTHFHQTIRVPQRQHKQVCWAVDRPCRSALTGSFRIIRAAQHSGEKDSGSVATGVWSTSFVASRINFLRKLDSVRSLCHSFLGAPNEWRRSGLMTWWLTSSSLQLRNFYFLCWLDYYNSLFTCCRKRSLNRLQIMQNALILRLYFALLELRVSLQSFSCYVFSCMCNICTFSLEIISLHCPEDLLKPIQADSHQTVHHKTPGSLNESGYQRISLKTC